LLIARSYLGTGGAPGTDGLSGSTGRSGTGGDSGTAGVPGMLYLPGKSGVPGTAGVPGIAGVPGWSGTPGTAGVPGIEGVPGMSGLPGTAGVPGIEGVFGPVSVICASRVWSASADRVALQASADDGIHPAPASIITAAAAVALTPFRIRPLLRLQLRSRSTVWGRRRSRASRRAPDQRR
jgi:hypothetical protein